MIVEQMCALIAEYLNSVQEIKELFFTKFGEEDLLRARRSGVLPREGWLDQDRDIRYLFHGVGCLVESGDEIIDFDFGPKGRVDGFDLWRLRQFLESRVERYPELATEEAQEAAFTNLVAQGVIVRSGELPSPHLFRVSEGTELFGRSTRRLRPG